MLGPSIGEVESLGPGEVDRDPGSDTDGLKVVAVIAFALYTGPRGEDMLCADFVEEADCVVVRAVAGRVALIPGGDV